MKHAPVKRLCSAMLPVLALSLTACASKPPPLPAALPALPPQPSLSTPLPPVSYSQTAAERIKSWRDRLTATQLMRGPSAMPGL
ncbi:hypothetical protein PMI14_02222 [Acidovorax sp. CF316]|nr:hypothetical protein PMI14_02222 [Acidovorax sp. CF316]